MRRRDTRVTTERSDAGSQNLRRFRFFFIIFVDAIFTSLFEHPFTKVFEVIVQSATISCLYRPCNAD